MHAGIQSVLDDIIAELEQGVRPWVKPWNAGHEPGQVMRPMRATGEAYSGVNVLLLWLAGLRMAATSPTWMTFRMAKELGGHVRAGEKGTVIVFTKTRAVSCSATI